MINQSCSFDPLAALAALGDPTRTAHSTVWPWHGPWSGVALERRFPRDLEYTRAGDEREQELAGQDGTQPTLRYLTK